MAVVEPSTALPIDDENAPLYSVGQVATMLELQQAFLRRLDEFDVVRPRRTEGGQRRYSRVEIGRVQYVVGLIGEGMTLAAIRRVLELEQRVRDLERRREEDTRRIRELESRSRPRRAPVPPM
jgi:MerR family transcriptional regulator/heat shock protein HspR